MTSVDSARSAAEILEAAPVGFARTTPDGRILYANEAFVKILGYESAEEVLCLDAARDIYADPRQRSSVLAQMNDPSVRQRREIKIKRKDGSTAWVEVQSRTVRDEEGRVLYYENFVTDVTERVRSESALTQSEERWRGVYGNSRIGIALVGPKGRFTAVNARYQELVGYSEEELRGMSFLDITHPDDREENQRLNAELKAGRRKNFQIEKRYRCKDGHWIWVRTTVFIVPGLDGTAGCEAALVEDITQRKRAEEELSKSECRLRAIFDNALDTILLADDESRFVDANPAAGALLGYGREELIGMRVADITPPENRPGLDAQWRQFLLRGQAMGQYEILCRNGSRRIVEGRAVARALPGLHVSVLCDVTERTRLESELKISEAYLAEGQRLSHTGSWAWQVATGELFWSQETFRIVGVDPATIKPSHQLFLQRLHPEDRPRVEEELDRALRDRADFDSRYRLLRLDGSIAHLHSLGHPAFDAAGELVEFVGVGVDETEGHLAGEQLDRSLHELRALSSRLQTIRDEEAARIAREVHDEVGQSLTALAMDVAWLQRKLSRRGPKVELAAKLGAMSRLVDSTLESVQRIASDLRPGVLDELGLEAAVEWAVRKFEERTGVSCRFEASLNGAAIDSPRATAAFRILQEALSNIARHARATRVEVLLSARTGSLRLDVRDNGLGIEAVRIGDSSSLGLLGMRERARSLGGSVAIDRAPEGGTRIRAQIPL